MCIRDRSDRIAKVLEKYDLKTSDIHSDKEIISAMNADKKRTANAINFTLLHSIGNAFSQKIKYEDIPSFFGLE